MKNRGTLLYEVSAILVPCWHQAMEPLERSEEPLRLHFPTVSHALSVLRCVLVQSTKSRLQLEIVGSGLAVGKVEGGVKAYSWCTPSGAFR